MKKYRILSVFLLLAFLLSGCSNKSSYGRTKTDEQDSMAPPGEVGESAPSSPQPTPENTGPASLEGRPDLGDRKLIKNGSYELESIDFDQTITAVEALISASGGYIENSRVSGIGTQDDGYQRPRSANYVIRIPADNFESFGKRLADCGAVVDSSESVDEVTDYYYDLEAHVHNLQIQEQRLLTLVGQAADLETIVALETTLADVRYKIESNQGQLRRLDSQISLSTVHITVDEVFDPVRTQSIPRTLGERISQRFIRTWDNIRTACGNFVVWLLGDSLTILIWLTVFALAALAVRAIKRRRNTTPNGNKNRHTFWKRRDGGKPPPSDGMDV